MPNRGAYIGEAALGGGREVGDVVYSSTSLGGNFLAGNGQSLVSASYPTLAVKAPHMKTVMADVQVDDGTSGIGFASPVVVGSELYALTYTSIGGSKLYKKSSALGTWTLVHTFAGSPGAGPGRICSSANGYLFIIIGEMAYDSGDDSYYSFYQGYHNTAQNVFTAWTANARLAYGGYLDAWVNYDVTSATYSCGQTGTTNIFYGTTPAMTSAVVPTVSVSGWPRLALQGSTLWAFSNLSTYVIKSTNGGVTWTLYSTAPSAPTGPVFYDSGSTKFFAADTSGNLKSTTNPSATTWATEEAGASVPGAHYSGGMGGYAKMLRLQDGSIMSISGQRARIRPVGTTNWAEASVTIRSGSSYLWTGLNILDWGVVDFGGYLNICMGQGVNRTKLIPNNFDTFSLRAFVDAADKQAYVKVR